MNVALKAALHAFLALGVLLIPTVLILNWVLAAGWRLEALEAAPDDAAAQVAIASAAEEGYCSVHLKKVLRRVLQSCGLLESGEVRGCQPLEAKNIATLSGPDFNALFLPLAERAGIIQFDSESDVLDRRDQALLEEVFADQQGGSYFFVVARASPDGNELFNRNLSQKRGEAVLTHLQQKFQDPDLAREVGLLWLGEEFAQLDDEFCSWKRSGPDDSCRSSELNRSAFVAWIDCRL